MEINSLNPKTIRFVEKTLEPLARYHRYEVVGLNNIPAEGPCILVFNHSFATYDGFLFGYEFYKKRSRLLKALGDNLIFQVPRLAKIAGELGIYPASPEVAGELLKSGHLVGVAPGGMREALRPSGERYQVRWAKRLGFIRLAIETGVPIVLCACPRADDIYTVYELPITKLAYKLFKVPLPIVRGMGLTLIPRPVKLVHYVSEPIYPPKYDQLTYGSSIKLFHRQVSLAMRNLLTI